MLYSYECKARGYLLGRFTYPREPYKTECAVMICSWK